MKKVKENVCGLIIIVGFFLLMGIVGWYENHYTLDCKVVGNTNGVIKAESGNGNIWEFTANSKDYPLGTEIELTMFTNYTTNIKDDEIFKIKIRY